MANKKAIATAVILGGAALGAAFGLGRGCTGEPTQSVRSLHPDLYRLAREPSIVYDSVRLDAPEGLVAKNSLPGEAKLSFYLAFPEDVEYINKRIQAATEEGVREQANAQATRDKTYRKLEAEGLLTQVVLKGAAVTPEMLLLAADNLANADLDAQGNPNFKYVELSEEVLNRRTMEISGAQADTDPPFEAVITNPEGIFFAKGYEWVQKRTPLNHPRYKVVGSSSEIHLPPTDPASAVRYSAMGDVAREVETTRRISADDLQRFRTELYNSTKSGMTADATEIKSGLKTSLEGDAATILEATDNAMIDGARATLTGAADDFQGMLNDKENTLAPAKK